MPTYLICAGVSFSCASRSTRLVFGAVAAVADGIARIPHHVVVAVLDQIAAEGQLHLQSVEGVGVGKSEADVGRRGVGAALEARERDRRRRLGRAGVWAISVAHAAMANTGSARFMVLSLSVMARCTKRELRQDQRRR